MMRTLHLTCGTSRARETAGWTVVTLRDSKTGKAFKACGGGFDLEGTVFAEWLEDAHADALARIAPGLAYSIRTDKRTTTYSRPEGATGRALYGLTWIPATQRASLDGGCGLDSMIRIAEAVGLEVKRIGDRRGHLRALVVNGSEGGAA